MKTQSWDSALSDETLTMTTESSMDNSTFSTATGSTQRSPETSIASPQEPFTSDPGRWAESCSFAGQFGFSPMMSENSQGTFPFHFSDVGSVMGAPALDYPAWDHFSTGTWSADTVSDPSMNESMPIGQDFLAFSPQGVANAGPDMSFPAWCSPQDTIATTSLPMLVNDASDDLKFMPQTAGFVGSPAHSALSHAGSDARDGSNYAYNNATLAHPRLVRPQVAPSYMTQDAIQEPQPTGAVNEHASQSASSYVQPRRISILAQQQNHQVRPVPASLRLARYPELKTNPSPAR